MTEATVSIPITLARAADQRIEALEAENKRLRGALEQIEEELHHPRTPQERVASRVARRALGLDPPDAGDGAAPHPLEHKVCACEGFEKQEE